LLSKVDLAVKPLPALHDASETQKPKTKSPATVVLKFPLDTVEDEPLV